MYIISVERNDKQTRRIKMNLLKQFLKEIRKDWEIKVLGKQPRDNKGRFVKRESYNGK